MNDNDKSISLRIEGGFLFKPYLLPYTRKDGGGHAKRPGWTPDRTPEMQARFDELKQEVDGKSIPDALLWKKVEHERGEQLARMRRPYPGWFPTKKSEKQFQKPYLELFIRMNPDADKRVRLGGVWSGPKAAVPPDGDYILEGGIMRPATEETAILTDPDGAEWRTVDGETWTEGERKMML